MDNHMDHIRIHDTVNTFASSLVPYELKDSGHTPVNLH